MTGEMSGAVDAQRLMNAYAKGLRRYLAAERALVEAAEPIGTELVYEHHQSAEDFRVIRRVLDASLRRSTALHAAESSEATGA